MLLFNHHATANAEWYKVPTRFLALSRLIRRSRSRRAPVRQHYPRLERDGHPFWPFWETLRSWWATRVLPNVFPLHFADLKSDMPGEIRRIAAFLDIPIDGKQVAAILENTAASTMKEHATKSVPLGGAFGTAVLDLAQWGPTGRWRDALERGEERYERRALSELGSECAAWLSTGRAALRA
jgi:aryl sulfotransferase